MAQTKTKAKKTVKRAAKAQSGEQTAQLAQQIVAAIKTPATTSPVVGIRNIGNETVGLPASPVPGEPPVTLHADTGMPDPNVTAIVSLPWWLQLRKSRWYGLGLFKRDDSILGPQHSPAPADRPEDCAPDHQYNAIEDAIAFIEGQSESQLRARIAKITSEPTLRKLLNAVDQRVVLEQEKYDANDPERADKAVKDMPALYAKVESLVEDRLAAIRPRIDI